MKRLVFQYIKGLRDTLNLATGNAGLAAPTSKGPDIAIGPEGRPTLPPSFNPTGCSKQQLEKLMRRYLSAHYRTWFAIVLDNTLIQVV